MYFVNYPINDASGNISYTSIFREDITAIFTMYNSSNSLVDQDLLSLMNTFTFFDWLIIFSAIFLFAMTLLTGRRILHIRGVKMIKPHNTLWEIVMFCLDQDTGLKTYFKFDILISLLMTLFFFFGMVWMTENMSTDLMVASDPFTIETYDDVLKYTRPFMAKGAAGTEHFRFAPTGSIEKKIYEKIENDATRLNTLSYIFGDELMHSFLSHHESSALIFEKALLLGTRRLICNAKESVEGLESLQTLITTDPSAHRMSAAFIMNKHSMKHDNHMAIIFSNM